MPCPTCDHTMEGIGQNDRADNFFLCPRCGTVKIDAFGQHGDMVYVPKLVQRCRSLYLETIGCGPFTEDQLKAAWKRVGIAESINLPEHRPQ